MLLAGCQIHIAMRATGHNEAFGHRLHSAAENIGAGDQVRVVRDEEELLHEKGILGEGYCISGSMNLTESGVRLNDEQVRYSTEAAEIAELRVHFSNRYGS